MAEEEKTVQVNLEQFAQKIKDSYPPIVKFEDDKPIKLDFGDDKGQAINTAYGEKLLFNVTDISTKIKMALMISHKGLVMALAKILHEKKKIGKLEITRTGKGQQTKYAIKQLK